MKHAQAQAFSPEELVRIEKLERIIEIGRDMRRLDMAIEGFNKEASRLINKRKETLALLRQEFDALNAELFGGSEELFGTNITFQEFFQAILPKERVS